MILLAQGLILNAIMLFSGAFKGANGWEVTGMAFIGFFWPFALIAAPWD